ncbi:hypothetical protein HW555_002683 [Spodoptera exigua]|uniref:Uncharacterized protein n=1 Tax=Spodoptera exigua TaxID=7107 RepID=A0A835GNJ6_SPOEX|nr:hypothetical protein HW555_002683 [Spodoptera exigua]
MGGLRGVLPTCRLFSCGNKMAAVDIAVTSTKTARRARSATTATSRSNRSLAATRCSWRAAASRNVQPQHAHRGHAFAQPVSTGVFAAPPPPPPPPGTVAVFACVPPSKSNEKNIPTQDSRDD